MSRLYPLAAAANVWALVLIFAGGFAVQLITGELPCPLCVMQRIALILCALGPLPILLSARDGALTARAAAVGNGMAIVAALLARPHPDAKFFCTFCPAIRNSAARARPSSLYVGPDRLRFPDRGERRDADCDRLA